MKAAPRLNVKFKGRKDFGTFCMALHNDGVPFSLAGFQTLVIAQAQLEHLPPESNKLFVALRESGLVEVYPTSSIGTRRLPTRDEAEDLLSKFTQARRCR